MRNFDIYFSQRWSFSWILAWRSVDLVNRTFRIGPKTFCIGFLRYCLPLWETNASESCETQPNCGTIFHNCHNVLVVAFSFFWNSSLGLFVWLFINLVMREHTFVPGFASRSCFVKVTLGRMPVFTERSRTSTLQNICTVVEEWTHGYCCLGYFSSSTHFYLVKGLARKVWRQCFLVLGARSWGLVAETASVSLRTLAFFFPLGTNTISSFNAD